MVCIYALMVQHVSLLILFWLMEIIFIHTIVKQNDFINQDCVIKGDNTYKSIVAASICQTYRDNYILKLVEMSSRIKKIWN